MTRAPDPVHETVAAMRPSLIATRHHLHANPELSDQERETAAFVAERLRELGIAHHTGVGGHGVVATIQGAAGGPVVALRADMDALPILEENEVPHASRNPGVMHACGHDGHTAILLGVAEALSAHRESMAGTVKLLFQPAEETVGGAKRMCAEGAMEGVDLVVALHGWPQQVPLGKIGLKSGPALASADVFDITVRGRGAHAAYPHLSVDPILVASEIVLALQSIVSRGVQPTEAAVVTVAQFHAGTAYNIIPGEAHLAGTIRTLSHALRKAIPERIRSLVEGICSAHGAQADIRFVEGTPPTVNHPEVVALVADVAHEFLGPDSVVPIEQPTMGAEDFAIYLEHAPGAMLFLGLGERSPVHTPTFDFCDDALPIGVELMTRIALRALERRAAPNAMETS